MAWAGGIRERDDKPLLENLVGQDHVWDEAARASQSKQTRLSKTRRQNWLRRLQIHPALRSENLSL